MMLGSSFQLISPLIFTNFVTVGFIELSTISVSLFSYTGLLDRNINELLEIHLYYFIFFLWVETLHPLDFFYLWITTQILHISFHQFPLCTPMNLFHRFFTPLLFMRSIESFYKIKLYCWTIHDFSKWRVR